MEHELDQQLQYLRAALQQDRRPLGLLIGAGAPMAVRVGDQPIIHDMAGLTKAVTEGLEGDDEEVVSSASNHLVQGGIAEPNLENLLDYLRTLAAVPGSEPIRGFTKAQLKKADLAVCAYVRRTLGVRLPEVHTPYNAVGVWARAAKRYAPVEVFTTNYDLLLEQAFEAEGVPFFDGFVGSHRPAFDLQAIEEDALPTRWVRLWKLHGSINWQIARSGQVIRHPEPEESEGTLIYPSHLKYAESRRLPYLALLDRLRAFLRQPSSVLVSCGFSYRDEHINEVVEQALRANPTAAVQALLYGPLEQYSEAVQMAQRTPNLSLLAGDQGVVGLQQGTWRGGDTQDGAPATCDLGDFARLGALLTEVAGYRQPDESPETSGPTGAQS
ncbi:SIR2 family protein [Terrabacter sp. GCM10028922]|uniref:SIR2 family NAD-dependent protein deacylase n=1 Tax=Terrabacter sp. GCM10028922 TaxID=3273428 RepID=UPI00360EA51D